MKRLLPYAVLLVGVVGCAGARLDSTRYTSEQEFKSVEERMEASLSLLAKRLAALEARLAATPRIEEGSLGAPDGPAEASTSVYEPSQLWQDAQAGPLGNPYASWQEKLRYISDRLHDLDLRLARLERQD